MSIQSRAASKSGSIDSQTSKSKPKREPFDLEQLQKNLEERKFAEQMLRNRAHDLYQKFTDYRNPNYLINNLLNDDDSIGGIKPLGAKTAELMDSIIHQVVMEEDMVREAQQNIRKQMAKKIIKIHDKHKGIVSPRDKSRDSTVFAMSPLIPTQFLSQEELNESDQFKKRGSLLVSNR